MSDFLTGEVLSIDKLKLPQVLYRYRCFNNKHHEESLFEREIYIPSAKEFNDPYDSKIPFRYIEKDLTEENIYEKCLALAKASEPNLSEDYYQERAYKMQRKDYLKDVHRLDLFDKISYERLCADFGIFCLTPDVENVLMWSYYANSHRGFCIGYNSEYLIKCGLFGMGGEVFYDNTFPKIPLFWTENDFPMLNILLTKWEKWKHENEYRLIHRYQKGKTHVLPPEAISEVVLGSQLSENEKLQQTEKIMKFLPDTKIFQIELDKNSFGLKKLLIYDPMLIIKFKK